MELRFYKNLYVKYATWQLPLEKLQSSNLFFKKGKKTDPSIYRPISLLLVISKILAGDIQDKTNAFLKENNLLYNYQPGFRPNHSTNLYQLFLPDKILKGSNEGLLTAMILIDLQEAFNTRNHQILFKKLKAMGFFSKG